ncbi:hypothetical protein O4H61_16485 [Roseovarius aestuarii]|nr:hypothetical protein [Roseovarius aestuarii]
MGDTKADGSGKPGIERLKQVVSDLQKREDASKETGPLDQLLFDLKGPHDDEAATKGVELGMSLAGQNRRDEFRLVFEAGYRAGFKAASFPKREELTDE